MSLVQLLTEGTMLPGFAKGVTGMGVGERRLIHIPWKLGYGKKGRATSWDLQPQWFDDLEANFSGFRGICKHQHTVFQIALICFFFFWFLGLSTTDTKQFGSCVAREETKDTSDERLRLRRILDLLWCRLEGTLQSIWCWAEKVRVFIVECLHAFDWASWCKPLNGLLLLLSAINMRAWWPHVFRPVVSIHTCVDLQFVLQ